MAEKIILLLLVILMFLIEVASIKNSEIPSYLAKLITSESHLYNTRNT